MPRKTQNNHTHKYMRMKYGSKIIYRCMLPDCAHYIFKPFAYNRKSICWKCGQEMILTAEIINHKQTKRPTCDKCRGGKEEVIISPDKKIIPTGSILNMLLERVNK